VKSHMGFLCVGYLVKKMFGCMVEIGCFHKLIVSVRASTPIFFARVLHSMAAEVPSRQAL
jgi:hypothetical protein